MTRELSNSQLCILRLIFHIAVLFTQKKLPKVFSPISLLYTDPAALRGRLFPTMMDDNLVSARVAMGSSNGAWYSCPRGHPYLIGDVSCLDLIISEKLN